MKIIKIKTCEDCSSAVVCESKQCVGTAIYTKYRFYECYKKNRKINNYPKIPAWCPLEDGNEIFAEVKEDNLSLIHDKLCIESKHIYITSVNSKGNVHVFIKREGVEYMETIPFEHFKKWYENQI